MVATDRTSDWIECGEWIRELRPHIDLYLLTDESIAAATATDQRRLRSHLLSAQRRHRPAQHGARRHPQPLRHTVFRRPARLRRGAGRPIPCAAGRPGRQHLQLQVAAGHGRVLRPQHLHGRDRRRPRVAWTRCWTRTATSRRRWTRPRAPGTPTRRTSCTNGTSTANKIVVQSLTRPGDIVLIDRNCHKSHHYGLVLAGAYPLYLDAYPLPDVRDLRRRAAARRSSRRCSTSRPPASCDRVRMVLLTNCTFDGVVYNPRRVMEEVLAIKPDICFLWDEAWYAFATAVPWARQRTAMVSARAPRGDAGRPRNTLRSTASGAPSMEGMPRSRSGSATGCCPTRAGPGCGSMPRTPPTSRCRRFGSRR